jgi:putative drug exporter of the RND superfamily
VNTTTGPLARIASWSQRHHWLALALWLAVLAGVTGASQVIGSDYHDDHSLPGTESARVADAFAANAPAQAGDSLRIVFQGDLADPRVDRVLSDVADLPHVSSVQQELTVADSGRIGFAAVQLDQTQAPTEDVRRIIDTAKAADGDGLRVELGGDPIRAAEEGPGGAAEGVGMLAALVILVFMFGSLLAAALPLITAIFAVGSTLGVIVLASHLVNLPSYVPPLMMLVGIGVGVDYALLIFARYRSELRQGLGGWCFARLSISACRRLGG